MTQPAEPGAPKTDSEKAITSLEKATDRLVDALYPISDALDARVATLLPHIDTVSPRRVEKVVAALGEAADILVQLANKLEKASDEATSEVDAGGVIVTLNYDERKVWDVLNADTASALSMRAIIAGAYSDEPAIDAAATRRTMTSLLAKLSEANAGRHIDITGNRVGTKYRLVGSISVVPAAITQEAPAQTAAAPATEQQDQVRPPAPKPTVIAPNVQERLILDEEHRRAAMVSRGIDAIITGRKPVFTKHELAMATYGQLKVEPVEWRLLSQVAKNDERLSAGNGLFAEEYTILERMSETDWIDSEALANIANFALSRMVVRGERFSDLRFIRNAHLFNNQSDITSAETKELVKIFARDERVQSVDEQRVTINLATLTKAQRTAAEEVFSKIKK